jgi:hypothetical protein
LPRAIIWPWNRERALAATIPHLSPALLRTARLQLNIQAAKSLAEELGRYLKGEAIIARPGGHNTSNQGLDTAYANFERLSPTTAQRVMRFWQVRRTDEAR